MRRFTGFVVVGMSVVLGFGVLADVACAQQRSRNGRPAQQDRASDGQLRSFKTKHYEVLTNLPDSEARPLALHMDRVFGEYADRLSAFTTKDARPVRMYLFDTRENYMQGLAAKGFNAANTGGVFFRTRDETALATFVRGQERAQMIHTLQHEGFHQFAHQRIGAMPQWANEGLAEYFGEGLMIGKTMTTGLAPESRLMRVRDAIERGQVFPFGEMLTMTNEQWNARLMGGDARALTMYDQAWAMAHFLVHADRGRYAGPFEDYLKALAQGLQPEQAFERAFKTSDFKAFEKLWTKYMMETLEPDALSTADERLRFMGMGIEMLHAQKVEIGSVGAIQEELRRRGFRVTYSGHGGEKELRADNDDLFRAPKPDRGRGNSTIELVRPRNRDEPVGVRIKGLRATAELVWERDSTGAWVHDVVYY